MTNMQKFLVGAFVALLCVVEVSRGQVDKKTPVPPAPVVNQKLFVVGTYDEKALRDMPPAQEAIRTAKEVQEYLKGHCAVDNGNPAYRLFAQDVDVTNEPQWVKDLMTVAQKEKQPVFAVKTAKNTVVQPWADTVPNEITELQKLGGK